MPTPAARLLANSLLAVVCGAAACSHEEGSGAPRTAELGVGGSAGGFGSGASGIAGSSLEGGSPAHGGANAGGASVSGGSSSGGTGAAVGGAAGTPLGGAGGAGSGGMPEAAGSSGEAGTGPSTNAGSGGTGVAGAGTAGASGSATGGGGATGDHPCESPTPILVNEAPSGMVKCADGSLARTGFTTCRLALSTEPKCEAANVPAQGGGYARCDDPCFDGAHGRPHKNWGPLVGYSCDYFCEVDADCPAGKLCACDGSGAGKCLPGGCDGPAACGPGGGCRISQRGTGCDLSEPVLRCLSPADACVTDAQCAATSWKRFCKTPADNDPLGCGTNGVSACGRPIVVAEAPLLAPLLRGISGWTVPPRRASERES